MKNPQDVFMSESEVLEQDKYFGKDTLFIRAIYGKLFFVGCVVGWWECVGAFFERSRWMKRVAIKDDGLILWGFEDTP